jgi:hypothetical protein
MDPTRLMLPLSVAPFLCGLPYLLFPCRVPQATGTVHTAPKLRTPLLRSNRLAFPAAFEKGRLGTSTRKLASLVSGDRSIFPLYPSIWIQLWRQDLASGQLSSGSYMRFRKDGLAAALAKNNFLAD